MTVALAVGPDGGWQVVSAFREETTEVVVVIGRGEPEADAADRCRAAGVDRVIATSPGAIPLAHAVGAHLRLVPSGHDVAHAVTSGPGTWSVDVVSLGGNHVVSAVYHQRVDGAAGEQRVRHRLSADLADATTEAVIEAACRALDDRGVGDAASTVELTEQHARLGVAAVVLAPVAPAVPADAAFAALGQSHQHLLAESVLRPHEFRRRIAWPQRSRERTLAMAPVWAEDLRPGHSHGGLRLIRRLTGFHSITNLVASADVSAPGRPTAVVAFVHADRESVENSLAVLHEFVDSGAAFGRQLDVVGYATGRT